LVIRILVAQNLQRRFSPGKKLVSAAHLVPAKDLFQATLWVSAFAGNEVEWRGRKMKLRRDGTLVGLNATVKVISKTPLPALGTDGCDLS